MRELVSGMLKSQSGEVAVYFTGGGGRALSEQLEWGQRYDADMVLRGLAIAASEVSRVSEP